MEQEPLDNDKKRHEIVKWDDSSTRLMLNFYKDSLKNYGKLHSIKTKQQIWAQLSEELSKYGYNMTPKQAQNRMLTLERSLKKRQTDARYGNRPLVPHAFDDDIREILDSSKKSIIGIDLADDSDENGWFFNDGLRNDVSGNSDNSNVVRMSATSPVMDYNRWDPESTKLFIQFFLKTVTNPTKMRTFKRKNKMWTDIANTINEHGYQFTAKQTQNRLSTLIRAYKRFLAKKRCGIRTFFLFEKEMQEVLRQKLVWPDRKDGNSEEYTDDDDGDEENAFAINFIDVDDNTIDSIDNINVHVEPESSVGELPQPSSAINFRSSPEQYAILNELKLLRKTESEFHQKVFKIEEEKLDLMRQNNILLKILIEKISKKS